MTTSPTGSIAPLSRRAIACLIDAAIAALIALVGYGITAAVVFGMPPDTLTAALAMLVVGMGATSVAVLAWFLVVCAMQSGAGSLGMRIMHLRLVRADTGAPIGFGRALLRNVVFGLASSIIVGYFTPLFDGSGLFQGWHDKAAGAIMLDVRGAAQPVAPPAAPVPADGFAPVGVTVAPLAAPDPAGGAGLAPALAGAPVEDWDDPDGATVASAPARHDPAVSAPAEDPAGPVLAPTGSPAAVPPRPADPLPTAATPAAAAPQDGDPGEEAMITTVPGISPSAPVAAPAPTIVSGPESVTAPTAVAPAPAPAVAEPGTAPTTTLAGAAALATPAAALPLDADDDDPEDTRISIPGHRLLFVWDDGARAIVSGRTLFGRNPAPEPGASVVVVRDETLSLSKTHFEAAAENAGGWVCDRHSTNGTTVVRDGVRIACPPGEKVRIRLGDAIEIGERIVTVGGYA
jgi:uncharacterized RDD family membrane protein YckC